MSREHVQLCAPLDQKALRRLIKERGFVFIQPKLKGIHLWWDGVTLRSAEGNELPALAHLSYVLSRLHQGRPLEGEAYVHGMSEAEINGLCHRARPDDETRRISLHVFDLIEPDQTTQERLFNLLNAPYAAGLSRVSFRVASALGLVRAFLKLFVDSGYEGIVIRDPEALWQPGKHIGCMKWKPGGEDYYTIVEVIQGAGQALGLASALIMADREGNRFTVGNIALTRGQRRALWDLRDEAKGRVGLVTYTGAGGENGLEGAVFRRFWELSGPNSAMDGPACRFESIWGLNHKP